MIEVVAGIIYKDEKYLIAKRNLKKDQGGLWEFPGGKVEKGETCEQALKREIREEFEAEIEVEGYVAEKIHRYPEKEVKVIFYRAKMLSKEIKPTEHEDYKWIVKQDEKNFEFAEADKAVLELI